MNYEGDRLSALCYGKAINPGENSRFFMEHVAVRNTSLLSVACSPYDYPSVLSLKHCAKAYPNVSDIHIWES